ncbi:MAG TPA: glycosyltransferase family 2 protein, partial [Steroidobacteraceae bacterium]
MPEVTVIMNCYNGERYLREAIDSVFAQTFADWEIIFWDNASTDGSADIARSYTDPRMRYFRGERNVPLGEARKLALAQARGEWIGFLDTDDLWYPQKLARQIGALQGNDHV